MNPYEVKLYEIELILLRAGFTRMNGGYKVPWQWTKEISGGDDVKIKNLFDSVWSLNEVMSIYVEYLRKKSAAFENRKSENPVQP